MAWAESLFHTAVPIPLTSQDGFAITCKHGSELTTYFEISILFRLGQTSASQSVVRYVLVAVIGPDWLACTDAQGQRRLDAENDLVRLELEAAMKLKLAVIPVLVGNSEVPKTHELPRSLRSLSYRNATKVRSDHDFPNDIERLCRAINNIVADRTKESDRERGPAPDENDPTRKPNRPRPWRVLRIFVAFMVTLLLGEFAFEGIRSSQFARHAGISVDTSATDQQLLESQRWFNDYSESFNGFAFAPRPHEAEQYAAKLESQLRRLRDRLQYGRVLLSRDIEACNGYITSAPLKTMLPEASRYRKYLNDLREQQELVVSLQIIWGEKCEPDVAYVLTLTVNARDLKVETEVASLELDSEQLLLRSEPGTSKTVGDCRFAFTDELIVEVRLTRAKAGFVERAKAMIWKHDGYKGVAEKVTLASLVKGFDMDLDSMDGDGEIMNQVRLVISNPPPPDLPEVWRANEAAIANEQMQ